MSITNVIDELSEFGVEKGNIYLLTRGAVFDVERGKVKNQAQLLQYCYLVAGSVGMMMCNLFETKEKKAHPYAVALGVAMQLTNICRDVLDRQV